MVRRIEMDAALNESTEALHFGDNRVISDHQAWKDIVSGTVRPGFLSRMIAFVLDRDFYAGND